MLICNVFTMLILRKAYFQARDRFWWKSLFTTFYYSKFAPIKMLLNIAFTENSFHISMPHHYLVYLNLISYCYFSLLV